MDVEKTMAFILAQQAAFVARQRERAEREAERGARRDDVDARIARLAALQDIQHNSIAELLQALKAPVERKDGLATTDQKIKQLTDNMNALVAAFEDLMRRENGSASA